MNRVIRSRRVWLMLSVGLVFMIQSGLGPARADHAGDVPFSSVVLGGARCNLIPVSNSTPIGITSCGGVRPGSVVNTFDGSTGGRCTINFLFEDSTGKRYAATAAHCVPGFHDAYNPTSPSGGDAVWTYGAGPEARDAIGANIGRFVYAFLGGAGGSSHDFALIRLSGFGTMVSDPSMCHFGGPVGMSTWITADPVLMHHYGNGVATGALPARTALAPFGLRDPYEVFAQGLVASGDSGSPILDENGNALGVIVTLGGARTRPDPDAGTIGILRLAHQVARAESRLGVSLTLLTAPLR